MLSVLKWSLNKVNRVFKKLNELISMKRDKSKYHGDVDRNSMKWGEQEVHSVLKRLLLSEKRRDEWYDSHISPSSEMSYLRDHIR